VASKKAKVGKAKTKEVVDNRTPLQKALEAQGAAERELFAANGRNDAKAAQARRKARAELTAAQRLVAAEEAEEKAAAARKSADEARKAAETGVAE
jgi:hypothetical protein